MRNPRDDIRGPAGGSTTIPVSDVQRENEERFRALAEHAGDAIAEIAPDARLLYVSPSFTETFGHPLGEVLGKSALELVHPEDLPEVDAIRRSAFAEERAAQLVFRLRHGNGTWRWVDLAARPYRTRSGELRAVLVGRDVTERVRSARALQEQLEAERCIAQLSRRLLNVSREGFGPCLREGLAAAGGVARADRAQLYLVDGSAAGVGGHYQWCAPGIPGAVQAVVPHGVRRFRWFAAHLLAGKPVHVPRVSDLPPQAQPEREGLEGQGVRAYLALPILHEGRCVGFIDFFRLRDREDWSELEITRLALIAEVLGGAVRRLRAEEKRREAEERFRTLAQHAQDTICELSLDGEILYLSENVTQLCGLSAAELRERDPWTLVHPEDAEPLRRDAAWVLASSSGAALTCRIRHCDGTWRWLESTVNPFSTHAGERRLAVVIRDVTARHLQRLELEHELEVETHLAEFSRALLETGADAVDDGIQHALEAAAQLAGADRSFLVSSMGGDEARTAIYDWHAPDVSPREHKLGIGKQQQMWILERLLRGEVVRLPRVEELPDEARPIREALVSGGIRSYLCIPIVSGSRLLGVVGFHCVKQQRDWSDRDVTLLRLVVDLFNSALRRKRAELSLRESQQRLLQAQKMEAVGTLAGGIAHDFNNQLTVMLANARYALREATGDEEVRQALGDLTRAAEHCAQLTRSLLAFSRRTAVSPRSLEVCAVAEEAQELLRPLIPGSIRFESHIEVGNARVVADPTQLQQVLVNLVVNARDAMPEGGHLWLTVTRGRVGSDDAARLRLPAPGSYVEFSVRDTGIGMDASVCARIFEPFFTTKAVGDGTGLGLATAYGIVEQCGGAISVETEPGRGSSFRVLLPVVAGDGAVVEDEPVAAPVAAGGTLLLAEDEASVRRLLARMLRGAGYEVFEASDGAQALRLGRQQLGRLDAVVTDVDMPRLSGVDLVRRLSRQRPDLPVLFISGMDAQGESAHDLPSPRVHFLAKPFTESALLECLNALLETS
jgi:PAS domain S-box-containing protein